MGIPFLRNLLASLCVLVPLALDPVAAQEFEPSPPEDVEEVLEGAAEEVYEEEMEPEYDRPPERDSMHDEMIPGGAENIPPDMDREEPGRRGFSPRGRPDPSFSRGGGGGNAFGTSTDIEFTRTGEKMEDPQSSLEARKERLQELKERLRRAE